MKHDRNDFYQHKVGYVHYNGTILADALKGDLSGNTVSLYHKKYHDGQEVYMVVEWDKDGQTEITVDRYDDYDNAVIKYISRTFNR